MEFSRHAFNIHMLYMELSNQEYNLAFDQCMPSKCLICFSSCYFSSYQRQEWFQIIICYEFIPQLSCWSNLL